MPEEYFWERFNEGKLDRRTFVKVASLLGGAAIFGLPLLGCQPAAAPKQSFEMKVGVPEAQFSCLALYSMDARFAKEAGISNVLTTFSGGGAQVQGVLTGGFPLTMMSPPSGMSALAAGAPARLIACGDSGLAVGWMVRPDSPYKKPSDLKGKKFKISYSRPSSGSHIAAVRWLTDLGIDPNDKNQVELVATGGIPDSWTATKGGVVDLGWSNEPTITQLEAKGEGRLLDMWWDMDFLALGVMTSQDYIDSMPDKLKVWVTAYAKATDWVRNNLNEAAKDLAPVLEIDVATAEKALKKVPADIFIAGMPKKKMEHTANLSLEFKLIEKMPDLKVLVNQSFLPENLRDPSY